MGGGGVRGMVGCQGNGWDVTGMVGVSGVREMVGMSGEWLGCQGNGWDVRGMVGVSGDSECQGYGCQGNGWGVRGMVGCQGNGWDVRGMVVREMVGVSGEWLGVREMVGVSGEWLSGKWLGRPGNGWVSGEWLSGKWLSGKWLGRPGNGWVSGEWLGVRGMVGMSGDSAVREMVGVSWKQSGCQGKGEDVVSGEGNGLGRQEAGNVLVLGRGGGGGVAGNGRDRKTAGPNSGRRGGAEGGTPHTSLRSSPPLPTTNHVKPINDPLTKQPHTKKVAKDGAHKITHGAQHAQYN